MTRQPIYLLSTGPLPERLVKEATERGVVLDVMNFIGTEDIDEITGMEKLVTQPLVAVFTSVNAVNAIGQWLQGRPDWRVYCISGATCEAVVELLGANALAGTGGTASELAEVIRRGEAERVTEIVFFCGERRRDELPSLGVVEKVVYRTVLTPHKVERDYDGIAFFSPSAVESFFSVNVTAGEIPLFAIGPTTAAVIRARCANPVITGEKPDKAILIRKMTDHFLNKR